MKKTEFKLMGRASLLITFSQAIPFNIDNVISHLSAIEYNTGKCKRWDIEITEIDGQVGIINLDIDEDPIYEFRKEHISSIIHNGKEIWDNENQKINTEMNTKERKNVVITLSKEIPVVVSSVTMTSSQISFGEMPVKLYESTSPEQKIIRVINKSGFLCTVNRADILEIYEGDKNIWNPNYQGIKE